MPRVKQDDVFSFVKAYSSLGTIVRRPFLEELANARGLDEMISKLKTTSYGDEVSSIGKPLYARKVESAFMANLSIFNYRLLKHYRRPGVLEAYFERNLSWNLKMAVKGKATGVPYEDLTDALVLSAEELAGRRDLIVRILSAATLEQAISLLEDSDVYPYLSQALNAYSQSREVSIFDLYVDRYTVGRLADAYRSRLGRFRKYYGGRNQVVASLVAYDVDSFLITALLRGKWLDLPTAQLKVLSVPGFLVSGEAVEAMVSANNVQAAADALAKTPYRRMVPKVTNPEAIIQGLEDAFIKRSLKMARLTFSSQPMSEPVLIGALKVKEIEVHNLATIAFGLEVGLQPTAILGRLTFA
jgi:V/A-type H+-transporting ATPase subunit C